MKNLSSKNRIYVFIALAILGLLIYEHLSYLDRQDDKLEFACSEVEDIRLGYKSMEWKPTGNKLVDTLEAKKPIGFTNEVQERLHNIELVCRNGITEL